MKLNIRNNYIQLIKRLKTLADAFNSWINNKADCINALSSIVMTLIAFIMLGSLYQTAKALSQGRESIELAKKSLEQSELAIQISMKTLDLQNKEFHLRNRPVVVLRNVRLAGPGKTTEGNTYDKTISFEMTNISDIPANKVLIVGTAYVGDKKIGETINGSTSLEKNMGGFSLPRDHTSRGVIFLPPADFNMAMAMKSGLRFRVVFTLTYSGMLGEQPGAYETYDELYFEPALEEFKSIKSRFK